MQSVDRSLYSVTEKLSERDRVTGVRTVSLHDRGEQIQNGNAVVERLVAEAKAAGKKINDEFDAVAYARVARVFSRLHSVSHLRNETWTPLLMESDEWNAFTTGGTYFVINSPLERDLKDDAELANVIAHEMAHTVANHGFERVAYTNLGALAGSKSTKRDSYNAAFTHENEAEADRIAALYCALAGFDPFAGERIWRREHERSGDGGMFIHDHPMTSERADLSKRNAEVVQKYYSAGAVNPDFASILSDNDLYRTAAPSEGGAGRGGGLLALLEVATNAAAQNQQAKLEEQRQRARIDFLRSVQRLTRVVESSPVADDRWRVTMSYSGNRVLVDVAITLIVKRAGQAPLRITKQVVGAVRPNQTFYLDFESPHLEARKTDRSNVGVIFDNARVG